MSNMKTSDIWPEGYKLTFDYRPSNASPDETFGFIFSSSEPCVFICDVVNNHDRMVEEIAELKVAFEEVKSIALQELEWRLEDSECGMCEVEEAKDRLSYKIDSLLAKLNQEGEE